MAVRVAINGLGRIGRALFRKVLGSPGIDLVAVNDLCDLETAAYLLTYDSVAGSLAERVRHIPGWIVAGDSFIRYFSEADPARLPWREADVDVVVECTGRFTGRAAACRHLDAGASCVVISAPSPDADITVVLGVNDHEVDAGRHPVVSNASCTTNCIAPPLDLLDHEFGVRKAIFTTVHSYTNGQSLVDATHADLRRARGLGRSIIPTTTGATAALLAVLPRFMGRIEGLSLRVPVPNVSLVDLAVEVRRKVCAEEVNKIFRRAAAGTHLGIIGCHEEPGASIDFNGSSFSAVVDTSLTAVQNGDLLRVVLWYDNENGFSSRLVDLVTLIGEQLGMISEQPANRAAC